MQRIFSRLALASSLCVGSLALTDCCRVCPDPAATPRPRPVLRPKVDGPPAKVVFLARHGRTRMNQLSQIGGQLPYETLDSLGFKQRVGLFLLLRNEPIKAVYTSELVRSQQTAAPLVAHFGLRARVSADLNEFRGGVSEGICYSLLGKRPRTPEAAGCEQPSNDPLVKRAEAFLKAENKRRFRVGVKYRWPGGGESLLDVDRRLARFVRSVPMSLNDKTILIVGHSGTNRFLLAKMMGWPMVSALRVRMGHTTVFRIERRGPGQKPLLKVYSDGTWHRCEQPPTLNGGLPCLPRKATRKVGKDLMGKAATPPARPRPRLTPRPRP